MIIRSALLALAAWAIAGQPIAARGASPAAFDRRCIPAACVTPPSNTLGILGRRALPAGRIIGLDATRDWHHGLLDLSQVRAEINALIAASGAEVAVAWRPLDAKPGEEILVNPTLRFHAASTMKVPVMIELFRQADVRRLKLSDKVLVTNQFTSIQDGSPFVLAATEDSDGETYKALGKKLTYRQLIEASITVSSNLATNILIEHLGARKVQATVDTMGASGMEVLRGVEDQKAFDAGKNNTTNALGLLTLFEAIGNGKAVSAKASADMLEILKRQKFNDGIPAGLPPGTPMAHKTGTITRIHHDAGIVYSARPYVLVILTRGILDQKISAKLMADIAGVIARATS